ncbi:MAG: GCN5-like N-acetyltransferase [Parcubacteria group bacterium Greene0416_79]|nr:MAG: GCN5-like N-acetyltransferase [Parcubacteria group bacterium Greene0416_79]
MEIKKETIRNTSAIKFTCWEDGECIAGMQLYLIRNDSHTEPYALLEDLFVKETHRKKGVGSALVKEAREEAKRLNCYKVIGTSRLSREHVHRFYERLGFERYGFEFRFNLNENRQLHYKRSRAIKNGRT